MTKPANIFLASLIAVMFIVAPTVVSARVFDKPKFGYCLSGNKLGDIKHCKENGGTK